MAQLKVGTTVNGKELATKEVLDSHTTNFINHIPYGSATGADVKVITLAPAPTALVDGMGLAFKNVSANTGPVTLNVNKLGAKSVLKSNGSELTSGELTVNSVYTLRYNGTAFILQGEGSGLSEAELIDAINTVNTLIQM